MIGELWNSGKSTTDIASNTTLIHQSQVQKFYILELIDYWVSIATAMLKRKVDKR